MATIDNVYDLLKVQNGQEVSIYANVIGPLDYLKQLHGFEWMKHIYDRTAGVDTNVGQIETTVNDSAVKINEMYLALVTADLAGKINQLYASVHIEQLVNQLAPVIEKLDEVLAKLAALGEPDDSYSEGQYTVFGLLNDIANADGA